MSDRDDNIKSETNSIYSDCTSSILDIPFTVRKIEKTTNDFQSRYKEARKAEGTELPAIFDALFNNFIVEFPQKLKNCTKDFKDFCFVHRFVSTDYISILNAESVVFTSPVYDFEEAATKMDQIDYKCVFITGRSEFKKMERVRNKKNYRECLNKKIRFIPENIYDEKQREIYEKQILKRINVIYYEQVEDAVNHLKAIVKSFGQKKEFSIKTKTFGIKSKQESLNHILSRLPGIGNSTSETLSEDFKNIKDFYEYLKLRNSDLEKYRIRCKNNAVGRILGQKQANIIIRAFLGKEKDQKITE